MKHEGDGDTSCGECPWNSPQRPRKDIWGIGDETNRDPPNHSTTEISLNT